MRKFLYLMLVTAVFISNAARADQVIPFYGELKSGVSFQNLDSVTNTSNVVNPATAATTSQSNTVGAFGAAVGVNFAKWGVPVRSEVEYDYRTDFGYTPRTSRIGGQG